MASGLIYSGDGDDVTMDALTHAALVGVEEDGPGRCEFVIFTGSPNPDSANFGPDEYCDEVGAINGYCEAHAWAVDS